MHTLIITEPGDFHTIAVTLALQDKGHEVSCWDPGNFPTQETISLRLGHDQRSPWNIQGTSVHLNSNQRYDVIWNRRPRLPVISEDLHREDIEVAQQESNYFIRAFWQSMAPNAFWVNPQQKASCFKIEQLKAASERGLAIPMTLMGNDPVAIRAFLNTPGATVYKPFLPAVWRSEHKSYNLETSRMRSDLLPPDEVLRQCPCIFQKEVEKLYELRVTIMGSSVFCAKLLTQELKDKNRLDWRLKSMTVPTVSCELPESIQQKCLSLMEYFGLVFGTFDFIVTPEGEHIFLEINEMGQFLWLEEVCSELPLLDAFSEFLISGDPKFQYKAHGSRIALARHLPTVLRQVHR